MDGGGDVVLSGRSPYIAGGGVLTHANHTIHGKGNVGNNQIGFINQPGGVIEADVLGETLSVDPRLIAAPDVEFRNMGTLRSSGGGILSLTGNGGGAFDSEAGIIESDGVGSRSLLTSGGSVTGGTFATSNDGTNGVAAGRDGSVTDIENLGEFVLFNNASLSTAGTIDNSGRIHIASTGSRTTIFAHSTVLDGGGTIELSGRTAQISGSGTLRLQDQRVHGKGNVGLNAVGIVNDALSVIEADTPGESLVVDPDIVLNYSGQGALRASAGGTLTLSGSGGGTFTVDAGGKVEALAGGTINHAASANLTNLSGGTLTLGDYRVESQIGQPAMLTLPGGDITTNAANILLRGPESSFTNLAALQTNAGSFSLENHAFTTAGNLHNTGTANLGAGGALAVAGNFSQPTGATTNLSVSGPPANTDEWGRLSATGNIALGGQFFVLFNLDSSFTPSIGDTWPIVSGTLTGGFPNTTVVHAGLPSGTMLTVETLPNGIQLRLIGGQGYKAWAESYGLDILNDGLPYADADSDGVSNQIEYALDMNPTLPDVGRLPSLGSVDSGGEDYLSLTFERPGGGNLRPDATYEVRRSTDLTDASTDGVVLESVSAVDPGTGRETVIYRSTTPYGTIPREQLKLAIGLQ